MTGLLGKLCCYDPRNPETDWLEPEDRVGRKPDCLCDNCFYGRSVLAERILELEQARIDIGGIGGCQDNASLKALKIIADLRTEINTLRGNHGV
jgi:hypothetical protein